MAGVGRVATMVRIVLKVFGPNSRTEGKEWAMAAEILEAVMLVCFGLSWPMNAFKSYKARTAAGTSWQFLALICAGYVAGIAAKFCSGSISWVLAVYFLNLACLAVNWGVYFRNRKLDSARTAENQAAA